MMYLRKPSLGRLVITAVIGVAAVMCFNEPLLAQDAWLSGRVMRRGYRPMRGAAVSYTHVPSGLTFHTQTDDSGRYALTGLPLSADESEERAHNVPVAVVTNSGGASHAILFIHPSPVRCVKIFDVLGRRVADLQLTVRQIGAQWQSSALWDGRTDDGVPVANGVFFAVAEDRSPPQALRFVHLRGGQAASPSALRNAGLQSDDGARSHAPRETLDDSEYLVRIEPDMHGERFLPRSFSRFLHEGDNGSLTDTVFMAVPARVLFVGNSYTYFNNGLDVHVQAMMREADSDRPFTAERVAFGGYTLEAHWNNAQTCSTITAGDWDWVVLQEQSTRPIDDPPLMFEYAVRLDSLIRSSGGESAFFMTWAREWNQTMIEGLAEAYNLIGDSVRAPVMPVGRAWQQCQAGGSGIDLYDTDGSHPTVCGTYLAACVFCAALSGESPQGITYDIGGSISAPDRDYLQSLAWSVIRTFGP
ncbi:hypothetical protein KKH27_14105 [bacterium]|nr:hypothetical protein [bacterium]MBU1984555.1 hypothetical protein [bacterium]